MTGSVLLNLAVAVGIVLAILAVGFLLLAAWEDWRYGPPPRQWPYPPEQQYPTTNVDRPGINGHPREKDL